MLAPALSTTSPSTSSAGFPDKLSSGDGGSKSSTVAQNRNAAVVPGGNVAHVIRKVKVFFEDQEMRTKLRPTAPFKRPPRVSGKHPAVQVEGLPLER